MSDTITALLKRLRPVIADRVRHESGRPGDNLHHEMLDDLDRVIRDGEAEAAKGGVTWRPMSTAPRDGKTQIVAKHKPNEHTPDGWVATITIDHDDGEYRRGGLDTIKHYNGDALMRGFHGVWTGWLYPHELASPPPPARDDAEAR